MGGEMTVGEIVAKYLKANGYDGLRNDDCGCSLEDFAPCMEGVMSNCEAAYKVEVDPEDESGWGSWMVTEKPKGQGMNKTWNDTLLSVCADKLLEAAKSAYEAELEIKEPTIGEIKKEIEALRERILSVKAGGSGD